MTSFLSYEKCVVFRPRLTNIKKNVRNRISFINFLLPVGQKKMLILTFVICNVLGRGTSAVVEKCKCKNNIVAVKKLHSNLPQNVTNIFAKEALLLGRISSKNVGKILGLWENPISIMMEHLEFSFVPFGRDIKVNSLEKF